MKKLNIYTKIVSIISDYREHKKIMKDYNSGNK
jgi:hypothetical protein